MGKETSRAGINEDLQRNKETLVDFIDTGAGEGSKVGCPILETLEGEKEVAKKFDR